MSILQDIVAHKRQELALRRQAGGYPVKGNPQPCEVPDRFTQALRAGNAPVRLVCELKPASPSAGQLQAAPDVEGIVGVYNRYASALSVLVDQRYFGGSPELFAQVRSLTPLPMLYKEFVLEPEQVREARLLGADAVLLIVKALSAPQLLALKIEAEALGMTAVLEVQNVAEVEAIMGLAPSVVLVNNRDLDTLAVDLQTTARLAPLIQERAPKGCAILSASGIESTTDIQALLPALPEGAGNFLVGTTLMRAGIERLEPTLASLLEASV